MNFILRITYKFLIECSFDSYHFRYDIGRAASASLAEKNSDSINPNKHWYKFTTAHVFLILKIHIFLDVIAFRKIKELK